MLTDTRIKGAKPEAKPYKLADSGGLYLDVRPSGQRIWRYRFRLAGKETIFTIGDYPAVTLADARMQRDQARILVKQGKNPTSEKKLDKLRAQYENAQTFEAVLGEWLATRDWGPATRRNREAQIDLHIRPYLGPLPMRQISPMMVLEVLRRAEAPGVSIKTEGRGARTRQTGGAGVARRLRQYIAGVCDLAVVTHRADSNPAGALRGALTKARKTIHKTPLKPKQVGEVLRAVDAYQGHFLTPVAFRLLWWSLARPGEVVGARWEEFDLENALWIIPADRMKMKEPHRVPLPRQALVALQGLQALTGGKGFVFPHRDRPSEAMTRDALAKATGRMGLAFEYSPHATRTTGSTILNEQGYRFDVIERQLAHQEANAVRRAYNRADYLDERREMMQTWADMIDAWRTGAKVTPLSRRTENMG